MSLEAAEPVPKGKLFKNKQTNNKTKYFCISSSTGKSYALA